MEGHGDNNRDLSVVDDGRSGTGGKWIVTSRPSDATILVNRDTHLLARA